MYGTPYEIPGGRTSRSRSHVADKAAFLDGRVYPAGVRYPLFPAPAFSEIMPSPVCTVVAVIVLILETLLDLWLLATYAGRTLTFDLANAIGVPVILVALGIILLEGLFAWQVDKSCRGARSRY